MPDDNKKTGGAVDVQKYLAGVDYPATKQDLIDIASDNSAPQEVIEILSGIDEKEYDSVSNVSKEVGKK